jgi:hypothetical protein
MASVRCFLLFHLHVQATLYLCLKVKSLHLRRAGKKVVGERHLATTEMAHDRRQAEVRAYMSQFRNCLAPICAFWLVVVESTGYFCPAPLLDATSKMSSALPGIGTYGFMLLLLPFQRQVRVASSQVHCEVYKIVLFPGRDSGCHSTKQQHFGYVGRFQSAGLRQVVWNPTRWSSSPLWSDLKFLPVLASIPAMLVPTFRRGMRRYAGRYLLRTFYIKVPALARCIECDRVIS